MSKPKHIDPEGERSRPISVAPAMSLRVAIDRIDKLSESIERASIEQAKQSQMMTAVLEQTTRISTRVERLFDEIRQLEKAIAKIESDMQSMQRESTSQWQTLREAKNKLGDLTDRVAKCEGTQAQVKDLEEAVAEMAKRLVPLEDHLKEKDSVESHKGRWRGTVQFLLGLTLATITITNAILYWSR
ncbi:MAG: hypothetical protein E6Q97_38420 [Desulfurellales bacterium]|nr:MAG: hypothetical protein E6Q97_38420 [Desulfurellales bacterium]